MSFKIITFAAVIVATSARPPLEYSHPALSYNSLEYPGYNQAQEYAPPITKYAAPALQSYAPQPVQNIHSPVLTKTIISEPTVPPHYEYGYSVSDPHTGDVKTQHETRKGDTVQGSYSVVDADGTKRTVEYTADPQNGFNVVIHKEPAVLPVKPIAPVPKAVQPIQLTNPDAKIEAPSYTTYSSPVAPNVGPSYSAYTPPQITRYGNPAYTYTAGFSKQVSAPEHNAYPQEAPSYYQ